MSNPTIKKTQNYSMFVFNPMNRGISKNKVQEIRNNIKETGFRPSDAIHVKSTERTNQYEIQRGHHRFLAAKEEKSPLYYIVDDSEFNILHDEKYRKDWTSTELAKGLANAGNVHYQYLFDFSKKYKMAITTCAMLLIGAKTKCGGITRVLRQGRFVVTNSGIDHASRAVHIIDACNQCRIGFANHRAFVQAISVLLHLPEFDPEKFIKRVKVDGARMVSRNQTIEYIEEIEALYNFRQKEYVPLKSIVIRNKWYR